VASRGILFLFLAIPLGAQNRLTPEEERGRQIFERGASLSGQTITASVAGADPIAGSILPCSNCHGPEGRGRPEGGIIPSDITWDALTKPYGLTHSDGRTHPPYTERLLKRAIGMGIDPAGNALNQAMPRYQLTQADASDLVAYIKRLGQAVDPGLTPTTVRLGVILPPQSGIARTSQIVRQTLLDYFIRVNGAGGVFSRRIELAFTELPLNPAQRAGAVRDFLNREEIFAVVCGAFTGAEIEIPAILRDTGTPAIATFAAFPQIGSPLNPYVFYLDGGAKEEAEKLLDFAKEQFPGKTFRPAIVSSGEEDSREAAKWLAARLAEAGYGQVVVSEDPQQPLSANLVFWLRPDSPARPMDQTIFLTAVATDPTRAAWDRTTASAEIVVEAMKRAGRGLTRGKLIEALEGFHQVETSLHAPVSFGPNRRVGASNVRIVKR